jgi:hypothetical protein
MEPKPQTVRLACVKHAASVRSEPGSNSQVHRRPGNANQPGQPIPNVNEQTQTQLWPPALPHAQQPLAGPKGAEKHRKTFKAFVTHQTNTSANAPAPAKPRSILANPNPSQTNQPPSHSRAKATHRTPPTYPFLAYVVVKERSQPTAFRTCEMPGSPYLKDSHHN